MARVITRCVRAEVVTTTDWTNEYGWFAEGFRRLEIAEAYCTPFGEALTPQAVIGVPGGLVVSPPGLSCIHALIKYKVSP